jgi:chromosome segregation ATPase
LAETRLQVQYRALVSLFTQAFEKITDLQLWKEDLEKQQELLEFKVQRPETDLQTDLNLTEANDNQTQESLEVLSDINRKLKEIKAELDTPEDHIEQLNAVLLNPEQHLRMETVSLKLSRLGIRLEPSSTEPANEFTVAEFKLGQGPKRVLLWIRVNQTSFLSARQPKQTNPV